MSETKKPKCNATTLAEVPMGVKPVFCKLAPGHEGPHYAALKSGAWRTTVEWDAPGEGAH